MSTTPTPTPSTTTTTTAAAKPAIVMMIPLMCVNCGSQLSAIFQKSQGFFVHVHQKVANAPNCPATGKKYTIGHTGVEEFNG